jgi:AcrR family transcriptional regulator
MPKLVDHELRRREIVDGVWRLIARKGFDGTTMRDLAAEMGLAYGAVNYYFPTKDDVLIASYEHVFKRTQDRFDQKVGNRRGMAALRLLAGEMMPIGDDARLEARILLPFWERCASSERFSAVNLAGLAGVSQLFHQYLDQAADAGETRQELERGPAAKALLTLISGAQALAVLMPEEYPSAVFEQMLDGFFDREIAGSSHP